MSLDLRVVCSECNNDDDHPSKWTKCPVCEGHVEEPQDLECCNNCYICKCHKSFIRYDDNVTEWCEECESCPNCCTCKEPKEE